MGGCRVHFNELEEAVLSLKGRGRCCGEPVEGTNVGCALKCPIFETIFRSVSLLIQ